MTDTNTSLVNINQTHGKYDIYRYVTKISNYKTQTNIQTDTK